MRADDDIPELDAEDRALVAKLRELLPEGTEPDWRAMEAAIRAQVGDDSPRPWWRNWRWIVPVWALATTAVIAIVLMRADEPARVVAPTAIDAGAPLAPSPAPAEEAAPVAMWLDGEVIELDDVPGAALDDLDEDARAALRPSE